MSVRQFLPFAIVAAASAAALWGCGSNLPLPVTGPHKGAEPTFVPFPHPAAKPEIIPLVNVKGENAVWVDGEWEWKGTRWVWQPGRWETPYPGSYYARPVVVRMRDGRLAWYRGEWHSAAPR
jgi:hypothetical protein